MSSSHKKHTEIKERGCDFSYRYDWLSMSCYESSMTCFYHSIQKYGGRKEQKQKNKTRKQNPLTPHRNIHSQNGKTEIHCPQKDTQTNPN